MLQPLHLRFGRQGIEYDNHIEANAQLREFGVRAQQKVGGANEASAFAPVDARSGTAVLLTAARADFDNHEDLAVSRHQVNFPEPPAKIVQQYLEPVIRQKAGCGGLGRAT